LSAERKERKKTILRTIRIDKDLDDTLNKAAKENGVSENALISSILAKYVEWDRYSQKFGFVSLPSEALKAIIEATEPDKLRTAVEAFSNNDWICNPPKTFCFIEAAGQLIDGMTGRHVGSSINESMDIRILKNGPYDVNQH
jgi:hypothetical protein